MRSATLFLIKKIKTNLDFTSVLLVIAFKSDFDKIFLLWDEKTRFTQASVQRVISLSVHCGQLTCNHFNKSLNTN